MDHVVRGASCFSYTQGFEFCFSVYISVQNLILL